MDKTGTKRRIEEALFFKSRSCIVFWGCSDSNMTWTIIDVKMNC